MPFSAAVGSGRPGATGRWHPLILIPLVLSAWVYYPILRVNFFADDLVHLASIESDGLLQFLLEPFGGHNYLVRNLFFLASWKLFGLRAPLYYATVLLTHLLNVALLFRVVRSLTASVALACFGATVWGTSPLCVGTLGWYSVYGQVLVATILLLVLTRVCRHAELGEAPRPGEAAVWYVLLLAGTTCFGVGIGVALAFPVALFLLLPVAWRQRGSRIAWLLLPIVTLALYFGFRRLYVLLGPLTFQESMQEYMAVSSFGALPPLLAQLLAFSLAGSTLGFFLPRTFPSLASTAAVIAFLAGLGVLFWRGDGGTRRAALAMMALALGMYFLIAVGRSNTYAMFSIPPAQAARVARYHYVGTVPVVITLCLIVQQLGRLPGLRAVPVPLALAAGVGFVVAGIAVTGMSMQDYSGTPTYLKTTADSIAAEVHAQPPGSTVYLENDRTPGYILGPAIPNFLFPGRAAVFVLLHPSDQLDGRTLRFIERDAETAGYYALRPATRLARLLVPPSDDAPRS